MPRRRTQLATERKCFVVITYEGCWMDDGPLKGQCGAHHVIVDCEAHGMLARVKSEEVGRFIMAGHLDQPAWPTAIEPVSDAVMARILASRTSRGKLFVPDTYRG